MSWYVGVDRGDRSHAVAVVDESGRAEGGCEIPHSREGLERLVGRLLAVSGGPACTQPGTSRLRVIGPTLHAGWATQDAPSARPSTR